MIYSTIQISLKQADLEIPKAAALLHLLKDNGFKCNIKLTINEAYHEILHSLDIDSYHDLLHLVKDKYHHKLLHALGETEYHKLLHVLGEASKNEKNIS